MTDLDLLQRFVDAQRAVYEQVCDELRAGAKITHWMWFVFPQLEALGRSGTAKYYGIKSIEHAQAYWAHPILGQRLKECVGLVMAIQGRTALEVFGSTDELKLRSCLTLFAMVDPSEPIFRMALAKFFDGRFDPLTLKALQVE